MTRTLALAALVLAGCVAGPTLMGAGNVDAMRADLRACTLEDGAWLFALIPDFGTTADYQRVKCMKQRGWQAGPDRSGGGIRDYARIDADASRCPERYAWNGNGCSEVTSAPSAAPVWATGE
jgi:hypothetical protein